MKIDIHTGLTHILLIEYLIKIYCTSRSKIILIMQYHAHLMITQNVIDIFLWLDMTLSESTESVKIFSGLC